MKKDSRILKFFIDVDAEAVNAVLMAEDVKTWRW
jgi:hypothetical protein